MISIPFGLKAINPRIWLWHEHFSQEIQSVYALIIDIIDPHLAGKLQPLCVIADQWCKLVDGLEYTAIEWHKEESRAQMATQSRDEYVNGVLNFFAPTKINLSAPPARTGLTWGKGPPCEAIPRADLYAISYYFFLRK